MTNLDTFNIEVAYEGMSILNTHDTVQALKHAMNKEADLYKNGKLIFSSMGLSHKANERLIAEHGIEMYLTTNGDYTFRSVNGIKETEIFADLIEYTLHGEKALEVQYKDYNFNNAVQFESYENMIDWLNLVYGDYNSINVLIACYIKDNENYTRSKTLLEINNQLEVSQ